MDGQKLGCGSKRGKNVPVMILQEAMKIAVQSRRLFSSCRLEVLSDPATVVTDQYGVQFVICVGMDVLISPTNIETIDALRVEEGHILCEMKSGIKIPASKIFQPHHTWIEQ